MIIQPAQATSANWNSIPSIVGTQSNSGNSSTMEHHRNDGKFANQEITDTNFPN